MKILFCIFQSSSKANGGVESMTQVIERLPKGENWVITQAEGAPNARWKAARCQVCVWSLPYSFGESFGKRGIFGHLIRIWSLVQTNWRVLRLIRSREIDLVVCNDPAALWHSVFGARAAGSNVVFNVRDTKSDDEPVNWFRWYLAFRITQTQVVLSQEMKKFWGKRVYGENWEQHPRAALIIPIYSIVDFDRMRPVREDEKLSLRQRLGIPVNAFALAYVATFNPKKGQLAFLEKTVPRLLERAKNARIYLVGDFNPESSPYSATCAQLIRDRGFEKVVECHGYKSDVSAYYQACDLIVLASRKEGLARCMIESLSCGTPVISFEVCSAREILAANNCGKVVPVDDHLALADAIIEVLKDPELSKKWSMNTQRITRTLFSADSVVREYTKVYSRLSKKRTSEANLCFGKRSIGSN